MSSNRRLSFKHFAFKNLCQRQICANDGADALYPKYALQLELQAIAKLALSFNTTSTLAHRKICHLPQRRTTRSVPH